MSLEYIIDGYNLIKHPFFVSLLQKNSDARIFLLDLIRNRKLCGSSYRNKIIVVFDGFFDKNIDSAAKLRKIKIVFSTEISADEWITNYVSKSKEVDKRNMVVVSNDKQIKYVVSLEGVKVISIEEFLKTNKIKRKEAEEDKPLNYSQIYKINEELRNIWNL